MQNIGFEQVNPLLNTHLEDFFGLEVGQVHSGFVNRFELLLLEHLDGHIANTNDQVLGRSAFGKRGRMDLIVVVA